MTKSTESAQTAPPPAPPSPEPRLSVRTYIETSAVKRKQADILRLAHTSEKHTRAEWAALAESYKGSEE